MADYALSSENSDEHNLNEPTPQIVELPQQLAVTK